MTLTTQADAASLPLVTAVLICWNHERFVRSAVLSALGQTYRNIQLIVFDNGSTDGSRRELEALRAEHEFTLICQGNVGLVPALNQALAMARGKYLALLATDDIWFADKTAKQVAFMQAHPDVHLVSGQVQAIDEDGRPAGRHRLERPGEATFADLMSMGCFVYGPTILCRTETLREMGGFDESMRIEDYSLALRLTHEGRRVFVLRDDLTYYRRHASSWTARSIDPELGEIGARFRHTPEYPAFYRHHFPLTFWRLVRDGQKRVALRLLVCEPVPWTWRNVGRGLIRMLIPYSLVRAYRALTGNADDADSGAREPAERCAQRRQAADGKQGNKAT